MKRILLISILLMSLNICAQNRHVTDKQEINEIKDQVAETCNKLQNLKCNYIQEKSISLLEDNIICKGEVMFETPNNLYWKNNQPEELSFVLKNDSVKIVNKNGINIMPVEEHLIFKEIAKIINNGISNKSIIDENNFIPTYEENEDYIIVNMKPKRNKMRSVLGNMILHLDRTSYLIHKIEIIDNNFDITTITLSDIYTNQDLDKTLFNF